MTLLERMGVDLPIVQAPMAGVSTPLMAAAVSDAGALGSIGIGGSDLQGAGMMISQVRERTSRPFNVNVFCHQPPMADHALESAWLERLRPHFTRFHASPPLRLKEIYRSFVDDDEALALLLTTRPPVVSFHFGLPSLDKVDALREAGILLLATATNLKEARMAVRSGVDAVVAQGYEAGGHRGVIDLDDEDTCIGTIALTRILVKEIDIPVIAAGGIMDGAGIAAVLKLGAAAAQLGTAFIACPESAADAGYRQALTSSASHHTVMTRAISGRPARALCNEFTALGSRVPDQQIPAYPIAYDAGKALNIAARRAGVLGFGAQWAGQGAPLARELPAAELVSVLAAELAHACGSVPTTATYKNYPPSSRPVTVPLGEHQ